MQFKQKYRLLFHKVLPKTRKKILKERGPNKGFILFYCVEEEIVCVFDSIREIARNKERLEDPREET